MISSTDASAKHASDRSATLDARQAGMFTGATSISLRENRFRKGTGGADEYCAEVYRSTRRKRRKRRSRNSKRVGGRTFGGHGRSTTAQRATATTVILGATAATTAAVMLGTTPLAAALLGDGMVASQIRRAHPDGRGGPWSTAAEPLQNCAVVSLVSAAAFGGIHRVVGDRDELGEFIGRQGCQRRRDVGRDG